MVHFRGDAYAWETLFLGEEVDALLHTCEDDAVRSLRKEVEIEKRVVFICEQPCY